MREKGRTDRKDGSFRSLMLRKRRKEKVPTEFSIAELWKIRRTYVG